MPHSQSVEIYRSENLVARYRAAGQSSDLVVVTFANKGPSPGLDNPGFAEAALEKRGVSAIHVLCRGNDWYQYPDMGDCMCTVAAFAQAFSFRVGYGSSMGAYAALLHSGPLALHRVLAVSPQYSIDPLKMPREHRWKTFAAGIDFIDDDMQAGLSRTAEIIVCFDPRNRDAMHVRRIQRARPVTRLAIPFSGHTALRFLSETALVATVVWHLLSPAALSTEQFSSWRRASRERRRQSAAYWKSLGAVMARRGWTAAAVTAKERAAALKTASIHE